MGRINLGRVVIGGLLAEQMTAAMAAINKPPVNDTSACFRTT